MPIRLLRSNELPALHRLYTTVTAPAAHGFPPTVEEFAQAFTATPPHLREPVILVAEVGGEIAGFARLGRYAVVPERWTLAEAGDGLLLGPYVVSGREQAGAMLLREAEAHLRAMGVRTMRAFDPVETMGAPFLNGGWGGLSERLPHVVGLLTQAGFRIAHRELCLTRPHMPPPPTPSPPAPFQIRLEERGQNRYAVRLYERSIYAGACLYSRMYPTHGQNLSARETAYIDGLGVVNTFQGRGLGRLLMCHGLARAHALGCGAVCLTTNATNHRAQNLYFSLGFTLVDSCVTFVQTAG